VTALGAAIDRRGRLLLVVLLSALAAVTLVLADRRPLWNDELFTYYVSRLPGVGDMWSTLATGVEQTPLSFYVGTRASLEALGDGGIAMRMPELLGFLLMSVCVFSFVERRTSSLYGLLAAIFPVATIAYGYAYEARAYALVLGFSAAALLCWQIAAEEGRHRRLAAAGTAVALAAAVGSHYYAVLILIPLLAGEATRVAARGRIDWLVLGSFCGALVPLAAFAPLIAEAEDYSTTFWAQPTWEAAIRFYPDSLMDRALGVVMAVCAAVVVLAAWRSRGARRRAALPPSHELAALLTLVLLPFFGVVIGKLVTGAFTDRYALSAIVGIAILLALAAWWTDRGAPVLGVSLLLVLLVFAGVRLMDRYDDATFDAEEQDQALALLDEHRDVGEPIVVASPHDFFELSHRVAEAGGPRLIYLADPALSRRYLETDAVELGVVGMKDIAPLRVEPYRRFVASHPRFGVYGRDRAWDWLTSELHARGIDTEVIARNSANGTPLVQVTGRAGASGSASRR
jgi:4-amino-4-deoxy-L-arabinose transferase-like glycosyltransferase